MSVKKQIQKNGMDYFKKVLKEGLELEQKKEEVIDLTPPEEDELDRLTPYDSSGLEEEEKEEEEEEPYYERLLVSYETDIPEVKPKELQYSVVVRFDDEDQANDLSMCDHYNAIWKELDDHLRHRKSGITKDHYICMVEAEDQVDPSDVDDPSKVPDLRGY